MFNSLYYQFMHCLFTFVFSDKNLQPIHGLIILKDTVAAPESHIINVQLHVYLINLDFKEQILLMINKVVNVKAL